MDLWELHNLGGLVRLDWTFGNVLKVTNYIAEKCFTNGGRKNARYHCGKARRSSSESRRLRVNVEQCVLSLVRLTDHFY